MFKIIVYPSAKFMISETVRRLLKKGHYLLSLTDVSS